MWSATRWHAYRIMGAMPYVDLSKAGIFSPKDLIAFPWDKPEVTEDDIPTDAEVEDTMRMLNEMNNRKTTAPE